MFSSCCCPRVSVDCSLSVLTMMVCYHPRYLDMIPGFLVWNWRRKVLCFPALTVPVVMASTLSVGVLLSLHAVATGAGVADSDALT